MAAEFGSLGSGEQGDGSVRVAGGLMLIRRHGGLVFADLKHYTGSVRLLFSRSDGMLDGVRDLDRGDWTGVEGDPMRTD